MFIVIRMKQFLYGLWMTHMKGHDAPFKAVLSSLGICKKYGKGSVLCTILRNSPTLKCFRKYSYCFQHTRLKKLYDCGLNFKNIVFSYNWHFCDVVLLNLCMGMRKSFTQSCLYILGLWNVSRFLWSMNSFVL